MSSKCEATAAQQVPAAGTPRLLLYVAEPGLDYGVRHDGGPASRTTEAAQPSLHAGDKVLSPHRSNGYREGSHINTCNGVPTMCTYGKQMYEMGNNSPDERYICNRQPLGESLPSSTNALVYNDDERPADDKTVQVMANQNFYHIPNSDNCQSAGDPSGSGNSHVEPSESCSSLSSNEGHMDVSNIVLMQGRPEHQMFTHNQVVLNQSHMMMNRSADMSIPNERQISALDNITQNSRSDVNYQVLEHNISHQSIMNQSISILNQQVVTNHNESSTCNDLSREDLCVDGQGEMVIVNSVPHQLVRTAEGLVLAMVGPQYGVVNAVSASNSDSGVSATVSQPGVMHVNRTVQLQQDMIQTITVPLGWRRIVNESSVIYISPSGAILSGANAVRAYLQTPGTCKCGLRCPLAPDDAFNFDPKVASKPYELDPESARDDLTRLCNHKRKLLAALAGTNAANSHHNPINNVSEISRKASADAAILKKTKRKAVPYSGVSVSQLLAQRERTHSTPVDNKRKMWQNIPESQQMQEMANPNRTASPTVLARSHPYNQHLQYNQHNQQPLKHQPPEELRSTDVQVNRTNSGAHYLTVNGGSINQNSPAHIESLQNENMKQAIYNNDHHNIPYSQGPNINHIPMNTVSHVYGPNGQIIGVHTGIQRHEHLMQAGMQRANSAGNLSEKTGINVKQNNSIDQKNTEANQNFKIINDGNTQPQNFENSSMQSTNSDAPGNIFCGSPQQSLTPEVMQKINQQQQLFIQQNQKQIEMAMKGIRSQIIADSTPTNYKPCTPPSQQFSSHSTNPHQGPGQLVIQNGVVMPNQPRTPPWQDKRVKANMLTGSIQAQRMHGTKQNCEIMELPPNPCSPHNNMDHMQMINQNQNINTNIYSRVPPLPEHCNQPQLGWPVESSKKKGKAGKNMKKTRIEMQKIDYPNMEVRHSHELNQPGNMINPNDYPTNSNPSFMDDPTAYLAQQTALLNNTISRQMGIPGNRTYNNPHMNNQNCPGVVSNNQPMSYNELVSIQNKKMLQHNMNLRNASNLPDLNNSCSRSSSNSSLHNSPSQSNIPDSSMEKRSDCNNQGMHPNCKGCMPSRKQSYMEPMSDNMMQLPNGYYMKRLQYYEHSMKSETDSQPGTPSPNISIEENPVTSSTYLDRPASYCMGDARPIQGGAISTSHVSPIETLQLPEPSPTLSNSSRNTDTPQSNNSGSVNMSSSCSFAVPSPAYSNPGSCRESMHSNPATPTSGSTLHNVSGQHYQHYGQGLPSNHVSDSPNSNVNKMVEEENSTINTTFKNLQFSNSSQAVLPTNSMEYQNTHQFNQIEQKRPVTNMLMSLYCPPPHLGGGPINMGSMVATNAMRATMMSGHTVIRDTITSVLAGKAQTATTSINASSANMPYSRPIHPNLNLQTSFAIPPNQPDPFLSSLNLPASYPMHIAGTIAQTIISKSPLEMVQSVVSSIPVSQRHECLPVSLRTSTPSPVASIAKTTIATHNVQAGQILISSTGQLVVASNSPLGHTMPPPAPKGQLVSPIPPVQASALVTNVTASVTQVIPAVGGMQQVINPPTVLVNTLPAPFVIQPQMMTVDGQVVQQNTVLPQLVPGNLMSQSQTSDGTNDSIKSSHTSVQRSNSLSPESKKRSKKRKNQSPNVGMLHIAAQQSPGGSVLLQHSPQHNSPQFSPRGYQVSPNQNISAGPMLQALTIVPGKSGTPAHIVMNSQPGGFNSQQIITNAPSTQQINLLQPVNLINNTTGVVPNFPSFQQFIVPGLGGMVMTADGTATMLQDTSGMPMQLQLQNINGQNVLTPVQNQGVLTTAGNSGVMIRTQNPQTKILQSQQSPGAQFLSPNSQIMMNSPGFNSQLSPLIANVSPTGVGTFNPSPQQVRPQEYIQCNQMGQTLMVPVSPNQMTLNTSSASNQSNSTFVQQNTTIVQQQTTMVANQQNGNVQNNLYSRGGSKLSIDPSGVILSHKSHHKAQHKQIQYQPQGPQVITSQITANETNKRMPLQYTQTIVANSHEHRGQTANKVEQHRKREATQMSLIQGATAPSQMEQINAAMLQQSVLNANVRHSVSTQTLVKQSVGGGSPPDTTTHSPPSRAHADTTTHTPEPNDAGSLAMVQCVSSSEPDAGDLKEPGAWLQGQCDFIADITQNGAMMQQTQNPSGFYNVESTGVQLNAQTISVTSVNNQHSITITPANYYQRYTPNKRKHEFPEHSYRNDKMMRRTPPDASLDGSELVYIERNVSKNEFNLSKPQFVTDSAQLATKSEEVVHKVYQRRDSITNNEMITEDVAKEGCNENQHQDDKSPREFGVGDLVWGPAKGFPWWPGKLMSREGGDGGEGRAQQTGSQALVRWFGDSRCVSVMEVGSLRTLSEGLEAHHAARTKCRKSRKLNAQLERAIQEAMTELDKMSSSNENIDSPTRAALNAHKKLKQKQTCTPATGKSSLGPVNSHCSSVSPIKQGKSPVKIAPHPNPGGVSCSDVPGRLRSSTQR